MSELTVKKRSDGDMAQNIFSVLPDVTPQLKQLSDVITCLRAELNKDLPIQHIALILAIVQQPGISMQGLMESLAMPQGSVSRNVKLLSDSGRGYSLLRNEQDLINRKQVVVFATQKCIDLVAKLCKLMQAEGQGDQMQACKLTGVN